MSEFSSLEQRIEGLRDRGLDLGSTEDAPSEESVRRTERAIGVPLPPSYLWFVKHYGGGEILGEEVFSIYGLEDNEEAGGDLLYQYKTWLKTGAISGSEIPICQSSLGELFVFDSSNSSDSGEWPVYRRRGDSRDLYATSFLEFFSRRLDELLGG